MAKKVSFRCATCHETIIVPEAEAIELAGTCQACRDVDEKAAKREKGIEAGQGRANGARRALRFLSALLWMGAVLSMAAAALMLVVGFGNGHRESIAWGFAAAFGALLEATIAQTASVVANIDENLGSRD